MPEPGALEIGAQVLAAAAPPVGKVGRPGPVMGAGAALGLVDLGGEQVVERGHGGLLGWG